MLIGHWPLDGNLNDISGNNNNLVYSTSTTAIKVDNEDGKLNSCYTRPAVNNGAAYLTTERPYPFDKRSFTLMAWVKVIDGATGSNASGVVTFHSHSHQTGVCLNVRDKVGSSVGLGTSRPTIRISNSPTLTGEWHHLALRYDGVSLFETLVDGVVVDTRNYNISFREEKLSLFSWSNTYNNSNNYRPAASLNEVRLYDEYLSDKEIQEISLIKVLHLTFDNPYIEPTTNLLSPIFDTSAIIEKDHGSNLSNTWNIAQPVMAGEEYTLSADFWRNSNHGGRVYAMISLRDSDGVQIPGNSGLIPGWSGTVNEAVYKYVQNDIRALANQNWYRYTWPSFKIPEGYDNGVIAWIRLAIVTNPTDASLITKVKNIQFEKQAPSTPYVNGVREKGIIKDISGFNNNGVMIDPIPNFSQDSKIGEGALEFRGPGTGRVQFGDTLHLRRALTFSTWFKYSGTYQGGIFVKGDAGGWAGNVYMFMRSTSGTSRITLSNGSSMLHHTMPSLGDNEWHHLGVTFDQERFKVFVDGVKVRDDTNTIGLLNGATGRQTYLGVGYGDTRYNGLVDEVIMYATAISEERMLALYNKRASLDNKGNLFISELDEQSNINIRDKSIITFTKINQVDLTDLDTDTQESFNEDGTIYLKGSINQT